MQNGAYPCLWNGMFSEIITYQKIIVNIIWNCWGKYECSSLNYAAISYWIF